MARSSQKKPGEHKCRGSGAQVEGRDWVRIGGAKWLREVAEQKGKFIPLEYRKADGISPRSRKAAAAAAEAPPPEVTPEAEAPPEPEAPDDAPVPTEEAVAE